MTEIIFSLPQEDDMGEQLTYEQLLEIVAKWYNTDASHIVETLNKYGVQYGDMESLYGLIKDTPYGFIYNADGSIRSVSYDYTAAVKSVSQEAAQQIDSNVQVLEKPQVSIPLESEIAQETGKVTFSSGLKAVGTGVKSALNFTLTEVVPAVSAASAGITLGKTIDKVLYNLNPDFWDEKGMSSLDPDTWNSITSEDNSTGARLFNMVFGLNPDDNTSQAYMDEKAFAYIAYYMHEQNLFSEGYEEKPVIIDNGTANKEFIQNNIKIFTNKNEAINFMGGLQDDSQFDKIPDTSFYVLGQYNLSSSYPLTPFPFFIVATDTNPATFDYGSIDLISNTLRSQHSLPHKGLAFTQKGSPIGPFDISSRLFSTFKGSINNTSYYVLGSIIKSPTVDGIGTQTDAINPNLSGVTDIESALQKLKETYPELWNNAITQDVAQPDGTTKRYTYVPVGFPSTNGSEDTQPTTGSQTQGNTKIDPSKDPDSLIDDLVRTLTKILTPTKTPNPPVTGNGSTPTVVPVTGSASSLYAIYNPTLAEINSFGAWLWSDNFIEQIKKLFNDPMQAIIGLHKVYAHPVTGEAQTIKVGYLDSGVSSKIVTNQYTTIDCGTITLDEQFFSVFDYAPYTEISLYLPFIGIVNLDVADVMRSSIHIIYHVDVLTGACLAEVNVTRDNAGGTLYQYAGNAAVTLPISSGSYMGIVASVASIAGGIAGTIASGGAAAPMLINAAGSALNARTRIEHSGGFSGNAGAMGGKIPYLIISRPQTELAENYSIYIGNPSNHTVKLSDCTGYIKVREVHLENIPATSDELTEIENLLKSGILV